MKIVAQYFYATEKGADPADLISFGSEWDIRTRPDMVAEDAAKTHMDNDGSDLADPCRWPITFYIYDNTKMLCGTYSVEMEYSPAFYARQI